MAQLFGTAPKKLPPGQSIYRVSGRALVNDREATLQTPIRTGDTVETAPNAELIFVVAEDAFILRGASRVTIETLPPNSAFKTAMRRIRARSLLTVIAILLVFGAIVFVLWLGAHAVIQGTMTGGELGQFIPIDVSEDFFRCFDVDCHE